MITAAAAGGVFLVALGMVLTPGPNMIYLASRSIAQGRRAGMISLAGVFVGFLCYLVAACVGLSSLFASVPAAFVAVKVAGAIYLMYLAWGMLKPGGRSAFETRDLPAHGAGRLFSMGLTTNLLNPKIALLYAALLSQFIDPGSANVWGQALQIGGVQIAVAIAVNALIVLFAARLGGYLSSHPRALSLQRTVAGTVLAAFAVKMIFTPGPSRVT